ncbi:ATP-binding protein [Calothrix sp. 336/3]|uniref:ATP-binding protein n=1 Tax=Calothrix sp. 336/3 TaxID=1337936 RepID=UPI000A7AC5DD|nr:ATP-binding protein [Calothrix sp. 336/3]
MSIIKYQLRDFLETASICQETTTLSTVWEILTKPECDRLVVLDQQQSPIGIIYTVHLLSQFLPIHGKSGTSEHHILQKPIIHWQQDLISPLQTLPANWTLKEFSLFVAGQHYRKLQNFDWGLVDSDGKFVGLIDAGQLLNMLRLRTQPVEEKKASVVEHKKSGNHQNYPGNHRKKVNNPVGVNSLPLGVTAGKSAKSPTNGKTQNSWIYQPLVKLLERLPWPLMLETSSGEVVSQNPAWWQQLGVLKDPEGVRQEVEAILRGAKQLLPASMRGGNLDMEAEAAYCSLNHREPEIAIALPPLEDSSESFVVGSETSNRCFLDREPGTCTCVVQVQSGQERIWQFAKIPLDSADSLLPNPEASFSNHLWLMLATDVTEQRQLSKELAAKNADLVQLNRLKDEFLACISHELKTPLTAVLGLSRLLIDQQLGQLNERQAKYAGLIHQSGRHLMTVVNDILDLTRMETGQMELALAPVNIRKVCDRAVAEAKTSQQQHQKTPTPNPDKSEHSFSLSIEPGLETIIADELRLRQMLVHLLSNAFKFTTTGGEIGLRINRWEGWVTFTVWDTGIGIPEHQQHLIFQKFQQLENPLTRQFEGTGLGLVLTRALARLHGGDVSFISREGKGSQFTLLLPPTPPHNSLNEQEMGTWKHNDHLSMVTPPANHPSPHSSSQRLVLVVEAVARYIEDVTEQLTGLGYRVVIARSGCEAVEKARRLQPKAIFLNPLLPLLSGWDVLTLLKSDEATRHIPIIVTATAAEKPQAFAYHADGFLSLPISHQGLVPLLDSLCIPSEAKTEAVNQPEVVSNTPLRILRLVNPEWEIGGSDWILHEHRLIEVDSLDQAELLARVWHFDVVLIDAEISISQAYLHEINQYPRLAALPIVTCDVATTQLASQIPGLSIFPCLNREEDSNKNSHNTLLSVLQIAAGRSCPASILVIDLISLPDLPGSSLKPFNSLHSATSSLTEKDTNLNQVNLINSYKTLNLYRGSEWFQALIQYLQTAGLKASIGRSWAELLQQLRHHSIDLLLICLGEVADNLDVNTALQNLGKLPFHLPPVLILDQRVHQDSQILEVKSLEKEIGAIREASNLQFITTHILPRSTSMEDLLLHINQALSTHREIS